MPRLKTSLISPLVALVALVATGFTIAIAQEPADVRPAPARPKAAAPARVPATPNPARMGQLLKDWETQSGKLKTLKVAIYRIDLSKAWDDEEHYEGRAYFKSPQLAFLDFAKVKLVPNEKKRLVPQLDKNKKPVATPYETIICTGDEVWQYNYPVKQIFVFPLDKNARKRALEEGPLPFLFNMKADDAKRRYDMTLLEENAKQALLQIKPKLDEDKESFSTAWVVLDAKYLLPTRIKLLSPDKKSTKEFFLSQIQPNAEVKEAFFRGVDPGKPWKVERNPGGQPPARANAPAPRDRPDGQAAQRPRAADVDQPR